MHITEFIVSLTNESIMRKTMNDRPFKWMNEKRDEMKKKE